MKGRAQSGLDFCLKIIMSPSPIVGRGLYDSGPPFGSALLTTELRIDQTVKLLSPILIQVLQNHILLDGAVAITFSQQSLA